MAIPVLMPRLGLTMEAGTIVKWLVSERDPVQLGQPLMEVETDKVVVEVEADAAGVIGPLLVDAGSEVSVGTLLTAILSEGETTDQIDDLLQDSATSSAASTKSAPVDLSPTSVTTLPDEQGVDQGTVRIFSSPRARTQAKLHGIDWKSLPGSGPLGRIVERDVLEAVSRLDAAALRSGEEALATQHFHLRAEVKLGTLLQMQHAILKADVNRRSEDVTVLDWLLKIASISYMEWQAALPPESAGIDLSLAFGQLHTGGDLQIHVMSGDMIRRSVYDYSAQRLQLLDTGPSLTKNQLRDVLLVMDLSPGRVEAIPYNLPPPQSMLLILGPSLQQKNTPSQDAVAMLSLMSDASLMSWQTGMWMMERIIELSEEPLLLLSA